MQTLPPLDHRTRHCLRLLGVNWLNYPWRKVEPAVLATLLLEEHGMAAMILRGCAEEAEENYESWVEQLKLVSCKRKSMIRLRTIRAHASMTAERNEVFYTGTEHLLLACLSLDKSLLRDSAPGLAATFENRMQAIRRAWRDEGQLDQHADFSWPDWAPLRILRVEDFPAELAEEAELIVSVLSLYSKKELLNDPAVRYALACRPRGLDELRRRLVEYFRQE